MKGLIWKRFLVAGCIVALLLNSSCMTVIADKVSVEENDSSELLDNISIVGESENNTGSQIEISQEEIKQEFSEPGKIT